jgi:hypothetical protein
MQKISLKYTGVLNPVVKGVGILEPGQIFECAMTVGAKLLDTFPKEYVESPMVAEEPKKRGRKPKTVEVETKMSEPSEFKAEPIF